MRVLLPAAAQRLPPLLLMQAQRLLLQLPTDSADSKGMRFCLLLATD
jgi:hypothetical protein